MRHNRSSLFIRAIVVAVLLMCAFTLLSYREGGAQSRGTIPAYVGSTQSGTSNNQALSPSSGTQANDVANAATRYHYGVRDLVGASPQDVGQFAKEYFAANKYDVDGTARVLLSQAVTRDEFTSMGLGCLPSFNTIEEPPLALVISKGNFDLKALRRTGISAKASSSRHYVAFVFDIWSAQPVAWIADTEGGTFRKALKDLTLPVDESPEPQVCPTAIPLSQRHSHYGDAAPGFTSPPPPPSSNQPVDTSSTPVIPPTPGLLPPPIPTAGTGDLK